ncbi:alpha-1,3-galactosidase A [Yeosuana aromativorans]|uniref:Alpha-1,3-galactosidase A n=1 Tax=Yeosuana aromativorans TaxID=288019 RepID=A0A8J3BV89_9FLAO|nr:right-handed parallel beta-helix repeat-containing protein [Yeosuana aromativorans]GGK33789.1 alpha-1,3-galactosidase A [Yeosuana aromativorans]
MRRYIALITILVVVLTSCSAQTNKIKHYFSEASNNDEDFTSKVFDVLNNDKESECTIEFKTGIYNFYPEKAYEKYVKISNNDNGLRKFIFALEGRKNITINGNGATFIFHGSVIPFLVENSTNIKIENINIEYDFPFDLEGVVVANNQKEKTFDLKINKENKYKIKDDILYFSGYDWEIGMGENIVYNAITKSPEYFTSKYEHNFNKHFLKATDLGNNIVRFSNLDAAKVPPVGSIYSDKGPHGKNRNIVGFRVYKSKNLVLNNINVYHSGAMALIAEKTETISLNKFNVILKEGSTRVISATADATHFINCKGKISMDDCRFENMLDDATNVHGTYMICDEVIDASTVALKFGHFQQQGFDFAEKGDTLRFIDRTNLLPVGIGVVKSIDMINENYYKIAFEDKIPDFTKKNIAIENITWMPSLEVKNCSVKQNRARSLLISTSKPVLIENNYFASMMAGIRICGDANYWFESGPVSNVTIRGNTFENLGVGGHSPQAILQIDPIIGKEYRKDGYYHKNIVFENNKIRTFDPLVIYALSVDGLIIRNNTIIQTKKYPQIFNDLSPFDLQNCTNIKIEGNTYKGDNEASISLINCQKLEIDSKQEGFLENTIKNPNKYFYQN